MKRKVDGPVIKDRTKPKRGNSAQGPKKVFGKWQPTARIRNVKH